MSVTKRIANMTVYEPYSAEDPRAQELVDTMIEKGQKIAAIEQKINALKAEMKPFTSEYDMAEKLLMQGAPVEVEVEQHIYWDDAIIRQYRLDTNPPTEIRQREIVESDFQAQADDEEITAAVL